jgi:iron(III) transport system permease protein
MAPGMRADATPWHGHRTVAARPPALLVGLGLVVAALALLPLAYLVVRALGVESDALRFLLRPRTIAVTVSTVGLAAAVGIGALAIGVPLAWLTTRSDLPGRRLWLIACAVPLAIPSYVLAFAVIAAFGPRGALASALAPLLAPLGVDRLPSIYGFAGAVLVLVLATYPYVLLSTRAALVRVDASVEEAARALGDPPGIVFRRVTLPLLVPAASAGALLAVLYALGDFGAVSLLGFDSLSRAIYLQYQASFDRSLAAILGLLLVGLTVIVLAVEAAVRRRAAATGPVSVRRPAPVVPLGRWRWPAMLFVGTVVGVALALPVATIAWWSIRAVAVGPSGGELVDALIGSAVGGTGAAVLAIVVALPVAVLVARHWTGLTESIERATYLGYALPGIVVALSVVSLASARLPWLYQTLPLLLLAYAIRFLPQAIGTTRPTLDRLGTRLEEAGRGLGDGPLTAFRRVTLPLVRPALVTGAALVFLTTVKELPLTLILGPIGFETLATRVWSATAEGLYAQAALPALVLVALSAASLGLLLRDGGAHA